jgi:hypothetical protein
MNGRLDRTRTGRDGMPMSVRLGVRGLAEVGAGVSGAWILRPTVDRSLRKANGGCDGS